MQCIQDTIPSDSLFTALEFDGLGSDTAVSGLSSVVGLRLHIAVGEGGGRCCGSSGLEVVAVDAADLSVSNETRTVLQGLAPGLAIADSGLGDIVGGWVAMPGCDVRVAGAAALGTRVIAISFADAGAFLRAEGGEHLIVRTTVVVAGKPETIPPGWRVAIEDALFVPLRIAGHNHDTGCAA